MFKRILKKTRYVKELIRQQDTLRETLVSIKHDQMEESHRQQAVIEDLRQQLNTANADKNRMAAVVAEVIQGQRVVLGIGPGRHMNFTEEEWNQMLMSGKQVEIRRNFPQNTHSIFVKE